METEAAAERSLSRAGYVIVERNWRGRGFEIDRIAWDGETLVFIEIRSRASDEHGYPEETIDRRKQAKVVRGALAYLSGLDRIPDVRFDVVAVLFGGAGVAEVELIPDAFDGSVLARGRGLPML